MPNLAVNTSPDASPSPVRRLLLVDGHYYAFRSFYAIQSLSNAQGEPTNAIFGMVKTLRKMLEDLKPDHAAVIFDHGLPEARLAIQPDYKSNRSETPAALEQQMDRLQEVVALLGFPKMTFEGEEADDLIASYACQAMKQGWEVILATNDKDLMQLVSPLCRVYQTDKGTFKLLTPEDISSKWGVPPEQLGAVLALTGDSVDNIPGVPGIGPKTASQLIRQFGSLEEMLKNPSEIASVRIRELIVQHRGQILVNQSMVALRTHLALPRPLETLLVQPDWAALVPQFEHLGFKGFLKEAQAMLPKITPPASTGNQPQQTELF